MFDTEIDRLAGEVEALLADPQASAQRAMPGGAYFLDGHEVLALPRDQGDSRYPYGQDGFNFWVYASGYMHSNEGLFSHFLRAAEGQEPTIAFFLGCPHGDGKFAPISLMPVPQLDESEVGKVRRYTVLTSTAAYFFTHTPSAQAVLRVFVTEDRAICFTVRVKNLTDQPQRLFTASYLNPFLRNQTHESGEDRWFKQVQYLGGGQGGDALGSFLVQVNEDKDRTSSITHLGLLRRKLTAGPGGELVGHDATTSRYQYVGGSRSSLHQPAALRAGTFGHGQPTCTFVENAITGDIVHLKLAPAGSVRLDRVFQYTMDPKRVDTLTGQPLDTGRIDAQCQSLREMDARRHDALELTIDGVADDRFKGPVFNSFIEHLKRQVDFCSLIKGYIQLSPNSLVGIRDVFQAIEAQLFWRPEPARGKMLEALGYTAPDGRCFRQYSLPTSTGQTGRMDLRPFIDQGVWVISCITSYLRVTGDWAFLEETCGYHEIVDESAGLVRPMDQQDSVLEHLFKIMDFLLDHRDHGQTGCVRAMYGDWNDALDGLGVSKDPNKAYGSGVSVMATLQVYQNCHEMAAILEAVDAQAHASRITDYKQAGDELEAGLKKYAVVENDAGEKRLVHGWGDERSYFVGGFNDPDGQSRDGLTSNAFWAISGLHDKDPSLGETILKAYDRLDSKYGLMTFEPYFAADVKGVGRIGKLPPGTAENGATYVHATVFAIMGLFQMGQARRGWEQLIKTLPFTDLHDQLSHSPFVMPNSYGYNPTLFIDGQNMNDWQTGSSNVVLKVLIRYVFGFEPAFDGLWIQPAAWAPFRTSRFEAVCRGRRVRIIYEDRGQDTRAFTVNGQPQQGVTDDVMGITKLWLPYQAMTGDVIDVEVSQ